MIACLVFLVVVSAALTARMIAVGPDDAQAVSTNAVQITRPAANAEIDSPTDLQGTIDKPLASGHQLWAVNRAVDEPRYHPQEEQCTIIDRGWTCPPLYLGETVGDPGKRFDIFMVDADPNAVTDFRAYALRDKTQPDAYLGLDDLPQGTNIIAQARVSRR